MSPASSLLPGHGDDGATREVLTPEGVPLRFTIARAGARLGAFTLDWLLVLLVIFVLGVGCAIWTSATGSTWAFAFLMLALFLLENFYFAWFEIRWSGSTPGKRKLGIRVIDARGGPLRAEAVLTRNITRNVEIFLPLTALAFPHSIAGLGPAWVAALAIAWLLVFALLPLFNRDRRRIGDLIGGTVVVRAPKAALLPDLSRTRDTSVQIPGAEYTFTPEQLEVYGIYELQVLEELLRDVGPHRRAALETVCDRIKRKIGWDASRWNVHPHRFLTEFYAAQRRRLEHKMLLGHRQEFKRDESLMPQPPRIDAD